MIPADRVETNVELSKILADLFPLLRAVQPAELNYTLNALATALEGRGEQLGETLDQLDAYLGAISDKLPTLKQDLISLANVADTYDLAAPDLIEVLGNLTVTSKTVIEKADDLDVFFSDLAGPGGHLDAGALGQREEPDPGRPGHRAGAQAAGHLLAGVPLPDRGRGQVRTSPGHDVRGQPGQAVHRVRHRPVRELPRRRPSAVRRGRARPLVRRAAEPQGAGRPRGVRRGLGHRREPAHRRPAHASSRAVPRRPRPAATPAPTPRRRSSTRSSPARPAGPPTPTAPWARCSTARS